MADYQQILDTFKRNNLNQESTVRRSEIERLLDTLTRQNSEYDSFDREVAG